MRIQKNILEFKELESKEGYSFSLKRNEKTLLELENGKVKKSEEEITAGKTYELLNNVSEILRNEILALDFQDGKKKLEAVLKDIEKEKEALGFDAKLPENFNEKVRVLEKADL